MLLRHSYTILYMDDDHDDLHLIADAFLQYTEKLKVVHALNGREGLKTLEKMCSENASPCLIIIDINMPVMDGKEALASIKTSEEFRHLPVVLFSTSNNINDHKFAREWGAELITKPSNFNDLEGLVLEFVNRCVFHVESSI